jgi:hypothetical protein
MWGFMTSRIVHETAWLSSRSGKHAPSFKIEIDPESQAKQKPTNQIGA